MEILMLKYFEFGYTNLEEKRQFKKKIKKRILRDILRRAGFLLFFIYATLFTAVATPFVSKHSIFIYFLGIAICIIIFLRIITSIYNIIKKYNHDLSMTSEGFEIKTENHYYKLNIENITCIKQDLFNNLCFVLEDRTIYYPLEHLSEESYLQLLTLIKDMTPMRTEYIRKWLEFFDAVVMAFILAVHIIQFIIQNYHIPSKSMEDTLLVKDRLFAEKITFGATFPKMLGMKDEIHLDFLKIRDVKSGDVIIFTPPEPEDQTKDFIKRCIAVEGEVFNIRDGHVYINGKKIEEPYVKGATNYSNFGNDQLIEGMVPEGMVVALGDNRENSDDSRSFGYVPVKSIKSRALLLYYGKNLKRFYFKRFGLIK